MNVLRPVLPLAVLVVLAGGCMYTNVDLGSLLRPESLEEKVVKEGGPGKILFLDIRGIISNDPERAIFGPSRPGMVSWVKQNLDLAEKDGAVKAVILRLDTPGGEVTACDILHHELVAFKRRRRIPVVAMMMSIAASGGYYLASAGDCIVAHPTTVTGSIGVIMPGFEVSGLFGKVGVREQTVKSGKNKDIGSWFRPMTGEEKKLLQDVIDSEYARFLTVVKESRGAMEEADWKLVKDGRIFTAEQAKAHHLVDQIGYLDDGIKTAGRLAGVDDATLVIYQYRNEPVGDLYGSSTGGPREGGLLEQLTSQWERDQGARHRLYYLWEAGLRLGQR